MYATFVRHFAREIGVAPAAVVSPDLGGAKRAEAFRERLETALDRPAAKDLMDKQRSMDRVTGELFAGDVQGRHGIIIGDLIASGTTMARVAAACRARGATRIDLAATHGLFAACAAEKLADPAVTQIVAAETVRPVRPVQLSGPARERLVLLPTAR